MKLTELSEDVYLLEARMVWRRTGKKKLNVLFVVPAAEEKAK